LISCTRQLKKCNKFKVKIHIHTDYNKAFSWIEAENILFIGYLSGHPELIPDRRLITQIFGNCKNLSSFRETLVGLNGVFSVIIRSESEVLAASDPSRFFPLFYCLKNNELFLSDDIEYTRKNSGTRKFDPLAKLEYLASAFTGESRTLFRDVYQICPGEAVSFSEGRKESVVFFTLTRSIDQLSRIPRDRLADLTRIQINHAFERILVPLKGKPILLPLSGGIDSRLIACQLKKHELYDVTCFTYGRRTREVEISRRVAEKLGFKWFFIEYTRELVGKLYKDPLFEKYYSYTSRGTSMFYLQEYPAIKWLFDKKIITTDYAVLPGHPGDLLRGSLLLEKNPEQTSIKDLPETLLKRKFIHTVLSGKEKIILLESLENYLSRIQTDPEVLSYSVQEEWELKERTSKYIMNSSHAFTYFGLKCFFPLADKELIEFFKFLPLENRVFGNLYQEVLYSLFFKFYKLDFADDIQPSVFKQKLSTLKKNIRPYLPVFIKKRLLLKNDWANYEIMTRGLLEELHKNNIRPADNGSSHLYRILNWYLMKKE
jgi:asparagine synthase (glutamine-hydrolysing)